MAVVEVQGVEHLLHRVGGVGVHLPVAGGVDGRRRTNDLGRGVELGQEPVERRAAHAFSSLGAAPGTRVRISKIEIVGRKRMNRKKSVRKRPNVPMNIDQSNGVPR